MIGQFLSIEGRVLPFANRSSPQKVSPLFCSRKTIQVQGFSFRSIICPENLHQNGVCDTGTPETSGRSHLPFRNMVPHVRLNLRPIQLHLLAFWKPSSLDYNKSFPITPHLQEHLLWWLQEVNLRKGIPLVNNYPSWTLTTDASLEGWEYTQGPMLFSGISCK